MAVPAVRLLAMTNHKEHCSLRDYFHKIESVGARTDMTAHLVVVNTKQEAEAAMIRYQPTHVGLIFDPLPFIDHKHMDLSMPSSVHTIILQDDEKATWPETQALKYEVLRGCFYWNRLVYAMYLGVDVMFACLLTVCLYGTFFSDPRNWVKEELIRRELDHTTKNDMWYFEAITPPTLQRTARKINITEALVTLQDCFRGHVLRSVVIEKPTTTGDEPTLVKASTVTQPIVSAAAPAAASAAAPVTVSTITTQPDESLKPIYTSNLPVKGFMIRLDAGLEIGGSTRTRRHLDYGSSAYDIRGFKSIMPGVQFYAPLSSNTEVRRIADRFLFSASAGSERLKYAIENTSLFVSTICRDKHIGYVRLDYSRNGTNYECTLSVNVDGSISERLQCLMPFRYKPMMIYVSNGKYLQKATPDTMFDHWSVHYTTNSALINRRIDRRVSSTAHIVIACEDGLSCCYMEGDQQSWQSIDDEPIEAHQTLLWIDTLNDSRYIIMNWDTSGSMHISSHGVTIGGEMFPW